MRPIQQAFAQADAVKETFLLYIQDAFGPVDQETKSLYTEIGLDVLSQMSDKSIKDVTQMLLTVTDDERDRAELQAVLRM